MIPPRSCENPEMTRSLKEDNRVIIFGSLTSRTRVFSGLFVSRKILDLSLAFS
jgi:hypothetical protein